MSHTLSFHQPSLCMLRQITEIGKDSTWKSLVPILVIFKTSLCLSPQCRLTPSWMLPSFLIHSSSITFIYVPLSQQSLQKQFASLKGITLCIEMWEISLFITKELTVPKTITNRSFFVPLSGSFFSPSFLPLLPLSSPFVVPTPLALGSLLPNESPAVSIVQQFQRCQGHSARQ